MSAQRAPRLMTGYTREDSLEDVLIKQRRAVRSPTSSSRSEREMKEIQRQVKGESAEGVKHSHVKCC